MKTDYLKKSIDHLASELKKDLEFYRTWKANITQCFLAELEYNKYHRTTASDIDIANMAASRFLHLLMSSVD